MIVTDVGGLRETIGDRGTGIVCNDSTPECIAGAITGFFGDPALRESCLEHIRTENERLSWSRFAKDLTNFVKE